MKDIEFGKVKYAKVDDIIFAILDSINRNSKMPKKENNYYLEYKDIGVILGNEVDAIEIINKQKLVEDISITQSTSDGFMQNIIIHYEKDLTITENGKEYLLKTNT